MNIPCPIRVNCAPGFGSSGELEFDSPLSNFSSLAPDQDLFIGFNFGWDLNIPNLGWTWTDLNWPGFCDSPLSQADANFCSATRQLINTYQGGYLPNNPWRDPNGNPIPLFFNTPQQCDFTCPDGLLFTWHVAAGYIVAPNQARANAIAQSIACQQAIAHHICLSTLGDGCLNTPYLKTITPSGGKPPFTFAVVSGSLPSGLQLSPAATSCDVTGTPDTAGEYTFTIRATDKDGNFMQKVYTVEILGITNIAALPHPTIARPYSEQLNAQGGHGPYTFAIIAGGLPDGLTLSTTGLISGTPTVHYFGAFTVTFQVTDSTGLKCHIDWNSQTDEPPGPDWTQLNWTAYPFLQGNPANSGSGSGNGPNAFVSLTCNTGAANVRFSGVTATGPTYTGPQVTCRIRYTVTRTPSNVFCAIGGGRLFWGGIQLGGFQPPGGFFPAPGVYDTDIIIPASVGKLMTLDDAGSNWGALLAACFPLEGLMHLDFTWQIFNL